MQFQLTNTFLLSLLPSILALPNAQPVEAGSLQARSCTYNGCSSEVGAKAGTYCGFCKQVLGTPAETPSEDIFQVNGLSGSRTCCDYGHSTSCAAHWPVVSPNRLVDCADTSKGY